MGSSRGVDPGLLWSAEPLRGNGSSTQATYEVQCAEQSALRWVDAPWVIEVTEHWSLRSGDHSAAAVRWGTWGT